MCGGMTCVDDINLKNSKSKGKSQFTGQRHEYKIVTAVIVVIFVVGLSMQAYAPL